MNKYIGSTQDPINLYSIDLRRKIKHFIVTGKVEDAKKLMNEHFQQLYE
jgi:hypothetical protein